MGEDARERAKLVSLLVVDSKKLKARLATFAKIACPSRKTEELPTSTTSSVIFALK